MPSSRPGLLLFLNSTVPVFGAEHLRPSVGPPPVTQPPRGRTKAWGCKTGHRIVQALGQGDPLGWRLDALLWSGFGSPWQRVRSHPGLSKVSARASRAREAAVPFILLQQPLKWGLFSSPNVAADADEKLSRTVSAPERGSIIKINV